jgi:CO/xanthine dehydrogenase Mo-binding subunit
MIKLDRITPSRREFMKAAGGLVVAISLPVYLDNRQVPSALAAAGPLGPLNPDATQIGSWLAIGKNGIVTVSTGKVELGTGTLTATRQIVAEELDVAFSATRIVQGITGQTVDQGTTAGSQTMRTQWATGLRIAAASARQALLQLAATRLGVPADQLVTSDGAVSVQGSTKKVSYAELLGGTPIPGTVRRGVKTKPASQYRVVGRSLPREDIPAKVAGTFTYVQDVKLPGMLHGRVVRPMRPAPLDSSGTALARVVKGTIANGTLGSVDESSVKHFPAKVQVVTVKDFVGVVAQREEHAIAAAQALKVTWTDPANLPAQSSLYQAMQSGVPDNTKVLASSGDVNAAMAGAARTVEATYLYPFQLHGSIGPSCAVAWVHGGQCEVWSGTQAVYPLRQTLATLLDMDPSGVRVTYVEGSGCYGLNGADDVSLAAALLSRGAGAPVRLQYMRADEMSWENFGTPMAMVARGGLDASGRIVGWDYQNWTYGRGGRPAPPGNLPTGVLAGFPEERPPQSPPPSPPLGDDGSNAYPWYAFPSQLVRSYGVSRPWLFTGPLRSPARIQNTFAQESFMDELAAAAGADAVAFRVAHTTDPRLLAVIQKAASTASWQTRPGPAPNQSGTTRTGRGIAAVRYEGSSSWVAAVITVRVDTGSGIVTPTQVVIAHDCGVVINPDGLVSQIQGNIVQGLSRSLKEEVMFDTSGVMSVDWTSYPIITFPELPDDVRIELIDRPALPALGAGEAAISVIPGAIANAIWDATGKRTRQVPFTPARVQAAMTT